MPPMWGSSMPRNFPLTGGRLRNHTCHHHKGTRRVKIDVLLPNRKVTDPLPMTYIIWIGNQGSRRIVPSHYCFRKQLLLHGPLKLSLRPLKIRPSPKRTFHLSNSLILQGLLACAVRFRQAISIYLYKCIISYIAVIMGGPWPNISISGRKTISRSEVRACRRVGACTFEAFLFGRFGVGILFFFVCLFETGKYVQIQHEPWINFF